MAQTLGDYHGKDPHQALLTVRRRTVAVLDRQRTWCRQAQDDADSLHLPALLSLGELMPADPAALGDIGVDECHQVAHRAGCAATRFALGHGRHRSGRH
ncbi:hypothetical protein ACFV4X_27690 [Streptomyces ardesiacus]|uniref:hypothetical protein n=1 Tax=Streptomyces ardesiacus TaxID=285564 RepID=UPI003668DE37